MMPSARSLRRDFGDVHPSGRDRYDEKSDNYNQERDDQSFASGRSRRAVAEQDLRIRLSSVEPVHGTLCHIVAMQAPEAKFGRRNSDDRRLNWSGGQGSDLRPFGPKPNALPPELPPDNYSFLIVTLRHLPPELQSGLSTMTVGTTNNTFRKFALEMFLGCISPDEDANIPIFLAGDVIELQHHDIGLAAIDTWVRIEIVPDILALLPSLALRTLISTCIVQLTIAPVVCFAICPLAFSTV
jgi:hypothetical protein